MSDWRKDDVIEAEHGGVVDRLRFIRWTVGRRRAKVQRVACRVNGGEWRPMGGISEWDLSMRDWRKVED